MVSHKVITTGGRRLRGSTCYSGGNFGLVDAWCMKAGVFLSHLLEVPAVMMESRFRLFGCDTKSLDTVSGCDAMSLDSGSGCDAISLGSVCRRL